MKFTPEMFGYVDGNRDRDMVNCVDAARMAQEALDAYVKTLRVVYERKAINQQLVEHWIQFTKAAEPSYGGPAQKYRGRITHYKRKARLWGEENI